MKRALSLILSILFVLGCVQLPAFSTEASAAASEQDLTPVTWSTPVDSGINGGYPRLATAASGALVMAYSAGSKLYIARSADSGHTWPTKIVAYDYSESGTTAANPYPYFDVETILKYNIFLPKK